LIQPIKKLIRSGTLKQHEAETLKEVVANGIPTQSRLFEYGLTTSSECKVCGGPGTAIHRYWDCLVSYVQRQQYGHAPSVLSAARATDPHPAIELLLTRALLRDGRKDVPVPTVEDRVEWIGARPQGVFRY
jgi:hypothetical protein